MKKRLAALSIATALMTAGCASQSGSPLSYNNQTQESESLAFIPAQNDSLTETAYQPSGISEIETVRTGINTAFIAAQPVYEQLMTAKQTEPALQKTLSMLSSAETTDEKKSAFERLSDDSKTALLTFMTSETGQQLMTNLMTAAKTAITNIDQFKALDTNSLMSSVGLLELISEKDKLAQTADQVGYLNSIVSTYNDYAQIAKLIQAH